MNYCKFCNTELVGRSDKKFCTTSCKSNYHQERRKQEDSFFFYVQKQLHTNRKILKAYNKTGFTTLRLDMLLEEGFGTKYFTHYWKNKKGEVYFFCFDYGYKKIKTESGVEKCVLVKWQDYMH